MNIYEMLFAAVHRKDHSECHDVLTAFRDSGGTSEEAYRELIRIRKFVVEEEGDEELEDMVLEVMDVVFGWCHPSSRVWKEPPKEE